MESNAHPRHNFRNAPPSSLQMGIKAQPEKNHGAWGTQDLIVLEVDPLVQLMKVEKTPDSTYEMIGGVDKQIKEPLRKGERMAGKKSTA